MGGSKSGGGGSTTVEYPTEMRNLYNAMLPLVQGSAGRAMNAEPLYPVVPTTDYPSAPYTEPSTPARASDYLSGLYGGYNTPTYMTQGYNIGNTSNLTPTQDWWSNLSSGIKEGIMQPVEEGADALAERLNRYGQLGSARGGVSGTGAAGLSNYYAKAMPQAEMAGWQMMLPGRTGRIPGSDRC